MALDYRINGTKGGHTAMAFLNVDAVSVSYGKVRALHDVKFQVEQGQIVTVIGANGAGKTTLINAVSGILNHSGTIRFEGRVLPKMAAKVAAAGIIQVPEGRRIFANLTVEENLILGGFGTRDKARQKADMELMYELYPVLKERRRQAAGSLSGGEQQMLAISRGLMSHPKLLMLDEPSLGLAPLVVKEVFALIKRLNNEGVTILLVEQNANKALQIADFAYVLENGRIVACGKGTELLEDPQVKEAYLGIKSDGAEL